jgi:hypothetical protein
MEVPDVYYADAEKPAESNDPFDALARHAIEEYRAGRTRDLREMANEQGIDLDEE